MNKPITVPKLTFEQVRKLNFVIQHIDECCNFDYLNIFVAVANSGQPDAYITELKTSSGSRHVDLTPTLVELMYDETILDIQARKDADRT